MSTLPLQKSISGETLILSHTHLKNFCGERRIPERRPSAKLPNIFRKDADGQSQMAAKSHFQIRSAYDQSIVPAPTPSE